MAEVLDTNILPKKKITIDKLQKQGFEDIITIHAIIYPPSYPNFVGTEFILENVNDEDIEKAKGFF